MRLIALLCLAGPATASRTSSPDTLPARPDAPAGASKNLTAEPAAAPARNAYVMTEQTEVLLNDCPCRYRDVPAQARVVNDELALLIKLLS